MTTTEDRRRTSVTSSGICRTLSPPERVLAIGDPPDDTVMIHVRTEVPKRIAHALLQEKIIGGKSHKQVVAEALDLYFDQRAAANKP